MRKPQILVCGAGPIGRRHIANLRALDATVTVWRERKELAEQLSAELRMPVETDLSQAIGDADGVVVATSTDRHVSVALAAANAGRALFIEPPLAPGRDGLEPLLDTCAALGLVVEIGCQRRLHPTLRALKAQLADPTDGPVLGFDIRAGEPSDSGRGEAVVFGLTHAIDIALWLMGPIDAVSAETKGEDLASLVVAAANGAIGQIVLDRLSPAARCTVEIMRRDAVLRWSIADGRLTRETAAAFAAIAAPMPGWTPGRMQADHLRHFVRRVADPAVPDLAPLEDAVAAVEIAMAARRAARYGRRVLMTEPPE
jgi:predicted dehydrogenase